MANQDEIPAEVIINISEDTLALIADVLGKVPAAVLLSIIECNPTSIVKVIECIEKATLRTRYATWTKTQLVPNFLRDVNWTNLMGAVANQRSHDVCWAIVVAELIRAIRLVEGRETDPNIRYSAQDLIDFANPTKRREKTRATHYCYTFSIIKGMEYVMKNGIQKEEDRPFTGCSPDIPDRISPQFGCIKTYKKLQTIDEMLVQLQHHPIGAALAMFVPEYKHIGNKMYRGPGLQKSKFVGLHAVSLVAAGEENGEKYVVARSSHGNTFGDNGYLKVSLEVMIVYVPIPDEPINDERIKNKAKKYFGTPNSLVRRFVYPVLFSEEEEEEEKKKHQV